MVLAWHELVGGGGGGGGGGTSWEREKLLVLALHELVRVEGGRSHGRERRSWCWPCMSW